MAELKKRAIPIAIHSVLGNDKEPLTYLRLLDEVLRRYPNLSFDISWRVLYDQVFKDPAKRDLYVALLNRWPNRFIPGTDFVAAPGKAEQVYREELALTSFILAKVNHEAYRRIALGQNDFELTGLEATAPRVCGMA